MTNQEGISASREEDIYAAALSELVSGEVRPGLWAKAFAESEGDEPKSKALYIRLRVQQEKDKIQQEKQPAQTIAEETAQRKATAFTSVLNQLNLKGYQATKNATGWTVREPQGARALLSSDDSLLEYAKGRVEVPPELLWPGRMNEQANTKGDESHVTTLSPTPSAEAFGNTEQVRSSFQRMDEHELLNRIKVGTLTEEAHRIGLNVPANRGVCVDELPNIPQAPFVSATNKGFFKKLEHGDFGLARTYWLYDLAVGAAIYIIAEIVQTPWAIVALLLPYFAYVIPVIMGTWRAATKYTGPKIWAVLAKVQCVVKAIMLAGGILAVIGLLIKIA